MIKLSDLFENVAYKVDYKQVGDNVSYAFIENKKEHLLYLYWQGSHEWQDWFFNFLFVKDCYGLFKAHKGFLTAYKEARNIVLDKVYEKDENGDYKWLKIIIVGYSHGSALTQLALQDIWYHRQDIKDCILGYAFESPRALKVKKKYRFMWDNMFVIRNNQDLVAHCPPKIFGYTDLGKLIQIHGDTSLVKNKMPKCIKSHYPQCVLQGLKKYEKS